MTADVAKNILHFRQFSVAIVFPTHSGGRVGAKRGRLPRAASLEGLATSVLRPIIL